MSTLELRGASRSGMVLKGMMIEKDEAGSVRYHQPPIHWSHGQQVGRWRFRPVLAIKPLLVLTCVSLPQPLGPSHLHDYGRL